MTDHQPISENIPEPRELEPELYIEPPRMTAKNIAGVLVALAALFVIGVAGYIWLNPELSWEALWHRAPAGQPSDTGGMPAPPAASASAGGGSAPADTSCAQCGMYADRSQSHVMVQWPDGSITHHDCWGCAFDYGSAQGISLVSAQVLDYTSGVGGEMLDASKAWFLYDTTASIEGSMSPFVAAFKDEAAAKAAQPDLGGEIVDFAGLKAQWE